MSDEKKAEKLVEILNAAAARIDDKDAQGALTLIRQATMTFDLLFGSSNPNAPAGDGAVNET